MQIVGSVVYGKHGAILIRQKTGTQIELGDLLVVEQSKDAYSILQVYDLAYGSQIPEKNLEMISGMKLEGFRAELDFMEPELRNYVLAVVKSLVNVKNNKPFIPKTLPNFMNNVRAIEEADLQFLEPPEHPIYLGDVRSGSKVLDVEIKLDGIEVFTHHILIPATTGRGKSNMLKVMLWSIVDENRFGILILDPHDEYFGRHTKGLKDHPLAKDNIVYYSPRPFPGSPTLVLDFKSIKPWHFNGVMDFSDAQHQALNVAFNKFKDNWICDLLKVEELEKVGPGTLSVVKRKIETVLGIYADENKEIQCRSKIFNDAIGSRTIKDILSYLEEGKKVIIDTSSFTDEVELLIGSIVLHEVFNNYKRYKLMGELDQKPVISIIVEEAPRVLSEEVLRFGGNIFSTISREGRKFKVGLTAITQLTSIIPKTVLANMNTKIILGNELASERKAIIDSASQDLSDDDQNIASLDKGEAIVSSNFTRFAVPIKIPLFEDFIKKEQSDLKPKNRTGVVM